MSTEAELRRIWGADFDSKIDRCVDHIDLLNPKARAVFDAGGTAEWLAVEALTGPAYRDPRHRDHLEASRRVSSFHQQAAGDDELIP